MATNGDVTKRTQYVNFPKKIIENGKGGKDRLIVVKLITPQNNFEVIPVLPRNLLF